MVKKLARAALSWVGAVSVGLVLCAFGAQADAKIRAGTPEPTAFVFSPVTVGIETGIFKKAGLDVERIDFAGGAKMHQAMAAGSLDVIIGTGSDMLFLIRGAPERGVAAYANDLNSLYLVVRNEGSIKSIAELKGKTIATTTPGSFTSWIAKTIAKKHGFGPDGIKLAYLGQMAGIVSGLLSKNVDAMVGTTSTGLKLESEGKARILVKAGDEIHDFIADILYASEPMMTQRPDELRRFLRAWFETTAFMKSHKAETLRITEKVTHLPDDIASKTYDAEMPTFFSDGHFDRKKLAAVQQALIDVGVIDKTVPDSQLVTEKFLP